MAKVEMETATSWSEYRRLVLSELAANKTAIEVLSAKIDTYQRVDIGSIKVDIAMLQVKVGVWGALAGLLPAIGVVLWDVMRK